MKLMTKELKFLFNERKINMYETNDKMVSHPSHYQSETGLEVIDVIEAFTFDLKGIEATDTGNIIKYICRWKQKNGLQDLKKAMWYLDHLITHVEKLEEENETKDRTSILAVIPKRSGRYPWGKSYRYDNLIYHSKDDAERVISDMQNIIKMYGRVTIADYYYLNDRRCNFKDDDYGWTDLEGTTITNVKSGYSIEFPPVKNLEKGE